MIGAGASGLGAARHLYDVGCKNVRVLEGRNRIGGRILTTSVGTHTVDLGASWIHGIGKGAEGTREWKNKYNPIYQLTLDNNI